jgi:hypothetical protein
VATNYYDEVNFVNTVTFVGTVNYQGTVNLPDGTVVNADIAASAEIDTSKQKHRFAVHYGQASGVNVVSATQLVHVARAAGELKSVITRIVTAPNAGDLKYTIDVQKAASGSGSWTTLLTAVIDIADADTDNTVDTATLIASPTLVAGDAVRVVVTVSGSTGTQGQGFVITIEINESGI